MHWLSNVVSKKKYIYICDQIMCSCDQLRKLVAQVRPVGRMSLEPCVCVFHRAPKSWEGLKSDATPRSKQQQLMGHVRMKPLTQRILSHMQWVQEEVTTAASILATITELNPSSLLTRAQPHIPPPFSFSIPAFTQCLSFHLSTHYSRKDFSLALWSKRAACLHV